MAGPRRATDDSVNSLSVTGFWFSFQFSWTLLVSYGQKLTIFSYMLPEHQCSFRPGLKYKNALVLSQAVGQSSLVFAG